MIVLLKQILKRQKEGKIYILLYNTKYCHAVLVQVFLDNNTRLILHFLPAYSQNLNIIEWLWHLLNKQLFYSKFYQVFGDFKKCDQ
jgi:hypothetical protein